MITFAYPTIAAPTALASFPDSAEQLPRSRPTRRHQASFDTDAGAVAVYDFGGSVSVFTLKLAALSQAQGDAIAAFFNNATPSGVNGRANAFQMQEADGSIRDVRFAQDVMEVTKTGTAWHEVMLTLRDIA